jgi:hypothetical protein
MILAQTTGRTVSEDRCTYCGGWPRSNRITLPRAKTGDLVFCGWYCMERWRAGQAERGAEEALQKNT